MHLNGHLWINYFREEHIPTIEALEQVSEEKLLPSFDNLKAEAEEVSNKSYEELGNRPGDGNVDMADLAEIAQDKGVSYYITMRGIEQGVINIMTAGLHHLFEQQLLAFHREELLEPQDKNQLKFINLEKAKELLKEKTSIDLEEFTSWEVVNELRLVANAVKHADGSAVNQLKTIRPKLFKSPNDIISEHWPNSPPGPVYLPIAGEDLYVMLDDFKRYADAMKILWKELGAALIDTENTGL